MLLLFLKQMDRVLLSLETDSSSGYRFGHYIGFFLYVGKIVPCIGTYYLHTEKRLCIGIIPGLADMRR